MKEDISNYSPTVMFRGTPCTLNQQMFMLDSIVFCSKYWIKLYEIRNKKSKLETRNCKLETRKCGLETRKSKLETRKCKLETRKCKLEKRKSKLETSKAKDFPFYAGSHAKNERVFMDDHNSLIQMFLRMQIRFFNGVRGVI